MSTNKIYGDNPNNLKFLKKNKRWELKKQINIIKALMKNFQ